jgi:hypothetical protein
MATASCPLLELVGEHVALALLGSAEGFVAGDGEQPGAQLRGVAELVEPASSDEERVLGDVGRLVGVAQHRRGEGVHAVGVPVVDVPEGRSVTCDGCADEPHVVHGS